MKHLQITHRIKIKPETTVGWEVKPVGAKRFAPGISVAKHKCQCCGEIGLVVQTSDMVPDSFCINCLTAAVKLVESD